MHKSWDVYFRNVEAGLAPGVAFVPPPSIQPGFAATAAAASAAAGPGASSAAVSSAAIERQITERLALSHLIRAYAVRGHEVAVLDPLNLHNRAITAVSELDYRVYGFTEADLDRTFDMRGVEGIKGFLGSGGGDGTMITLRSLIQRLQATYSSTIGWEYMHLQSREKLNWLRERVELSRPPEYSKAKRMQIFDRLAYSDHFERYLANKFNTAKRFGLEGCEALIPGLKALTDRATELGVSSVTFGMPHRGRLNVLVNVIRKPMEQLLKEFMGTHVDLESFSKKIASGDWSGSGDVKYHLGTSYDRTYPDGRTVHMSLVANPSHLEAVNTVVVGKVKAKQDITGDVDKSKGMAVLLHGDAAFSGQGIVYETFLLSQLKNYGTGGTVHIVCNNQVGFTTDPESSRSTLHCTDIGKAFDVPIFHVNADDPEAVTRVFEIAGEFRQQFKTDVIIDLVGYRKYGHNELDQPMFTQPVMYTKIANHPSALDLYQARLVAAGVATVEECKKVRDSVDATFAAAWEKSKVAKPGTMNDWLASRWKGFHSPEQMSKIRPTGVPLETLRTVGEALVRVPSSVRLHPSLVRIMKAKEEMVKTGEGFDWATAEALAFGSLLLEGNRVRLSGQDVERGTFSHRHAVLHDQTSKATHIPLHHIAPHQGAFLASNSPLSEFGVMGFELGYSMESPELLVIWEAQFGDFVNGAQTIIDQFISAGETKWFRQSGLTLLLPHGMEGQGPEHSSARIERFLQAVDDQENIVPPMAEDVRMQIQHTNMQVVNCTTPANYFHVLRRQVHRNFRKPLVVASPKSLLRHKSAVSTYADMADGSQFSRVYADADPKLAKAGKVRKVLLCSGKVYYDLAKHREETKAHDVAIVRVEQVAPFPFDLVAAEAKKYPHAHVAWVQEEPRNMGAWSYVAPRIATATRVLNEKEVRPVSVGKERGGGGGGGARGVSPRDGSHNPLATYTRAAPSHALTCVSFPLPSSLSSPQEYYGRLAAASPAAGSTKIHEAETAKFIAEAFA